MSASSTSHKPRRWSERTRMLLTLQLAVVLPAAALILFSIWNLRTIQRDRAVEAAIQRDFSQILKITQHRLDERAVRAVQDVRESFPGPHDSIEAKLESLLAKHPQFSRAFVYEPRAGLVLQSRVLAATERESRLDAELFESRLSFLKNESTFKELLASLQEKQEKGGCPCVFYANVSRHEDATSYESVAVMTLPDWPDRPALAGVVFDAAYLRDVFFPSVLDSMLADEPSERNGSPAALMLRWVKSETPLAASQSWDGGMPEVERVFDQYSSAFPSLALDIKFRGTTIDALSKKFALTNFLIIGGISVFLMLGIWQTYRNVTREMALARLKSDFVANVSHELRTPLSLIRLYAETLEMGRLTTPEKPPEYYRIIRKESERLTALINNILDFSRIEAGRKEYDFRETLLPELVRNTLEAYRFQIEQNGFAFEASIADDLPPVCVDREAIARSLLNLISNAVKYSPGEKFLGVNLYRENGHVRLEVIDHGMGIPRAEQGKIFEKFYRAGDPLVHNTKGSGLGLSLVRHIVQAHGGSVSVESTPGRGSKFTISLPLGSAEAPAASN